MPRLEELVTFARVVEQKSFSRAAELQGISQPAVSLQIKSLERDYGAELLHREGLEVIPTESGRMVYEFACQMIDLYERSRQRVAEMNGVIGGRFEIGSSSGPGESMVPLLLGAFKQQYPEVKVALRVADSREIVSQIFNNHLELGFVGTSRRDRYLAFDPFVQDPLVLVVDPRHAWAKRGKISYPEFLEAPLILQQQGSGATALLQEMLSQQGISFSQLNVVMELGLQESAKAAVRAGYGVTIISRLGVRTELERGELVEVGVEELDLKRSIYICTNRMLPLSNLAQTFLRFAQEQKTRLF